jgi:hypothetical protein
MERSSPCDPFRYRCLRHPGQHRRMTVPPRGVVCMLHGSFSCSHSSLMRSGGFLRAETFAPSSLGRSSLLPQTCLASPTAHHLIAYRVWPLASHCRCSVVSDRTRGACSSRGLQACSTRLSGDATEVADPTRPDRSLSRLQPTTVNRCCPITMPSAVGRCQGMGPQLNASSTFSAKLMRPQLRRGSATRDRV